MAQDFGDIIVLQQQRIQELEAALEPFAAFAGTLHERCCLARLVKNGEVITIDYEHCLQAQKLLSSEKRGRNESDC